MKQRLQCFKGRTRVLHLLFMLERRYPAVGTSVQDCKVYDGGNGFENRVRDRIKSYKDTQALIYAHADHDGICAAVGLTFLFGNIKTEFSRPFRPAQLPSFGGRGLFLVCDLLLTEEQIQYALERGLEVINFDHHDLRDLDHSRYICLNPKKLYKKEFISSSGLIWKLFRPERMAWLLAVGSAGDLAVEDNLELFEFVHKTNPDLLEGTDLHSIYNSKIFEMVDILLMGFDDPDASFELAKSCIDRGPEALYDSRLYGEDLLKQKTLLKFISSKKDRIHETRDFVFMNTSGGAYPGSYSVRLNLMNEDRRVYIEYCNGRLFFRNYFGGEDVRKLAALFGGGGSHPRAGGAHTGKQPMEVLRAFEDYYKKRSQTSLFR